ncbi:MAG: T9SS type A sorting domain-containing protein [Bacteroidetes bacterium]|nr:T9SS type A sorting domain-containing protein [Bacteroidota bacterium]
MKKFFSLIALILIFSSQAFSQTNEENLKSVVKVPPGYYQNQFDAVNSTVQTVNGYDNFFLGNDFGEPHIATNPRNPLNSICAFNTNSVYYTLDGYNWTKVFVSFPGFASSEILGDPVLAFDSLGNIIYEQLYQQGSTYGVVVTRSTDGGQTFSGAYRVTSTTVGLSDKEWICADQTAGPYSNYLYTMWRQFGSTGMRFCRSTNGGVNWSSPITLTGDQGAYVCVGPNGLIQGGSVYTANTSGGNILVARSTDGGATMGPQVNATAFSGSGVSCSGRQTVKGCIRTNSFPKIAADGSYGAYRGYVYVTYEANPLGPDVADVYVVRSTDYGQTWGTPVRVNDDATTADQWLPAISVDNTNGRIYVSWMDSREDPTNNLQTKMYGSYSTDGGATFVANSPVSTTLFNPDNMKQSQGSGQAFYIGDYLGVAAINKTALTVWMDGRANTLGSYVGYYPDYAMTTSASSVYMANNDSSFVTVTIPSVKGPFNDRVKFTAALDTVPASGSINLSFVNNKDSVTAYPDSIRLRIKTVGNVSQRLYKVTVTGRGTNGTPVHKRTIDLLANSSYVTVSTNKPTLTEFKINGVTYNNVQTQVFPNGGNVTLEAVTPSSGTQTRYRFVNWSNGGANPQTITVNGNSSVTANFMPQYKITGITSYSSMFGANTFYDSAQTFQFGIASRRINSGGTNYYFHAWIGAGNGSYTSPDSTGRDSMVTWSLKQGPIVESALWTDVPIGIKNITSEIPAEFNLEQNFPNPFNPVTNIKFDVAKYGPVKIVVYDLLGKEVNVVLNRQLSPGRYIIDFNAENLSSGIYFYKLITQEYVSIKKMTLLK